MGRKTARTYAAIALGMGAALFVSHCAKSEPRNLPRAFGVLPVATGAGAPPWTSRLGARPSNCPARRWCGCYLAERFGLTDRRLWAARQWLRVGRELTGPRVGAIAVYPHHVGVITEVIAPNRFKMLSGNDGGAVRERERSTVGVIGYRQI